MGVNQAPFPFASGFRSSTGRLSRPNRSNFHLRTSLGDRPRASGNGGRRSLLLPGFDLPPGVSLGQIDQIFTYESHSLIVREHHEAVASLFFCESGGISLALRSRHPHFCRRRENEYLTRSQLTAWMSNNSTSNVQFGSVPL
jgi:hypothetical protein